MSLEPITVDLTVEDTACRYALEVEETSVAFDVDVDSAIVFDTHPFFEGSYTVNPGAVNAGFSNSTSNTPNVTPKTPIIYARCNANYFSTTSAGALDQENSKFRMVGELYRSKPGGVIRSLWDGLIDLYNMDNSR